MDLSSCIFNDFKIFFLISISILKSCLSFNDAEEKDNINPKIIVIETATPLIHLLLQVAERLSQILPSAEIAFCGSHATVFA